MSSLEFLAGGVLCVRSGDALSISIRPDGRLTLFILILSLLGGGGEEAAVEVQK